MSVALSGVRDRIEGIRRDATGVGRLGGVSRESLQVVEHLSRVASKQSSADEPKRGAE